jgi:RNA polymerase-binding transcription factor DksA
MEMLKIIKETEVMELNSTIEKLYTELRITQIELATTLRVKRDSKINKYIEEELKDVEETMQKLENGNFGMCEMSGELLPVDLLEMIPTIRTKEDINSIQSYYRKSIH